MTADPLDIAKRAAEMRALTEKYRQLESISVPIRVDDVLAILDALARADARAEDGEQDLARLTVNASTAYDKLKDERDAALGIVKDTLWMARRYADGRKSYAASLYNDAARKALAAGIVKDDQKEPLFAHDGMGAGFAGLSQEEQNAAARYAGSLAEARETIGRLCEASRPLAEVANSYTVQTEPDDYIFTLRRRGSNRMTGLPVQHLKNFASALASVREAGADV